MNITRALVTALIVTVPFATLTSTKAEAKRIERACLQSDRRSASKPLCTCIQKVADQTLTRSDQKLAASFFDDPHKAQEIRQSDRRRHEEFWRRYKVFGNSAKQVCR